MPQPSDDDEPSPGQLALGVALLRLWRRPAELRQADLCEARIVRKLQDQRIPDEVLMLVAEEIEAIARRRSDAPEQPNPVEVELMVWAATQASVELELCLGPGRRTADNRPAPEPRGR
jgi:hypothetical protein